MTLKLFDSWLGRILAVVGILAVLYSVLHYVVKAELSDVGQRLEVANTKIAGLGDDIRRIDGDIKKTNDRIDAALSDAVDKLVGSKKISATGKLERGQVILSLATSINAKLRPASVVSYGKLVSGLTASSPAAWQNLTQAVNYRTFLNADYIPKVTDFTPATGKEDYQSEVIIASPPPVGGLAFIVGFAGGHVPDQESARLETISKPRPHGSGFGFIVVEGGAGAIGLDNAYLKNVIVRNAHVMYSGGPTKLENVYFVNCTFTFPVLRAQPQQRERQLSDAILEAVSVNFSNPLV